MKRIFGQRSIKWQRDEVCVMNFVLRNRTFKRRLLRPFNQDRRLGTVACVREDINACESLVIMPVI